MLRLTNEVYKCTLKNKKGEDVTFFKCIFLNVNNVSITEKVRKEHAQHEIADVINRNKKFNPVRPEDLELEHLDASAFGNVYMFEKK